MKKERKTQRMKQKIKEEKGITLIALVITIIVLLILAAVSIAMLTGENGILTEASRAAEETKKAEIIERAQTDILEKQIESKNRNITVKQLKEILDQYFKDVPDLSNMTDEEISNVKLTLKEEYGGYNNILLTDIYKGNTTKVEEVEMIKFYVEDMEYKCKKETTWEEFLAGQEIYIPADTFAWNLSKYNGNNKKGKVSVGWNGFVEISEIEGNSGILTDGGFFGLSNEICWRNVASTSKGYATKRNR